MTHTPLHVALLICGAIVAMCCLLIAGCSRPVAPAAPTAVAATPMASPRAPSQPVTYSTPGQTALAANDQGADIAQTAAVSPPANSDGSLPRSPGFGPNGGPQLR